LLGRIGSKGDLKQGILGALTAGFNAKVLPPISDLMLALQILGAGSCS
jgi:hypothetical protein